MSLVKVKVTTSDTELVFEVSIKTQGQELFNQVSRNLAMHEIWFFGLKYQNENNDEIWIDKSKKTLKDFKPMLEKLQYSIKYYPEDIEEELIEDNTIKYFFMEIRSLILADKIFCPPDTCVLLASYATHARYGDYNADKHNTDFLNKQKLLPARVYDQHKLKREEFHDTILKMWIKHRGMLKVDAMKEYLKLAQNLEMYGITYYEIRNKKDTNLLLGIHAIGINIFKPDDRMTPHIIFPWSEIKTINFKDKKFTIKPVDKKAPSFVFVTADASINKRILGLGIGNHFLYIRRRKPASLEIIQMKTKAQEQRKALLEQREKLTHEIQAKEKIEERYRNEIRLLKEEMNKSKMGLDEAQETIEKLREQLRESQKSKEELEAQQSELKDMMQRLEESKNMEAAEKQKLEDEIREKQLEVQRIQEEVHLKNEETLRLQQEVEDARRAEEELRQQQLEEAMRREAEMAQAEAERAEREELESVPEGATDAMPELKAVNEELKEQLKLLQQKLEDSRDVTKDTGMDVIHRENVMHGRDKFKTLAQIRQGNTTRRVDMFENF